MYFKSLYKLTKTVRENTKNKFIRVERCVTSIKDKNYPKNYQSNIAANYYYRPQKLPSNIAANYRKYVHSLGP